MKGIKEWGALITAGVSAGGGAIFMIMVAIYWLMTEAGQGNGVAVGGLMLLSVFLGVLLAVMVMWAIMQINMRQDAQQARIMMQDNEVLLSNAKLQYQQGRAAESVYKAQQAQARATNETAIIPTDYGIVMPQNMYSELQ